jgi:hypothetical protein
MLKKYVPKSIPSKNSIPPFLSGSNSPLNSPYASPPTSLKRRKNKKPNLNFFHDKLSGIPQSNDSKTVFSSFPEIFELDVHSPSSPGHSPSSSFSYLNSDCSNLLSLFPREMKPTSDSRSSSIYFSDNKLKPETPRFFETVKKTFSSTCSSNSFFFYLV